jgi:hypothetical protein
VTSGKNIKTVHLDNKKKRNTAITKRKKEIFQMLITWPITPNLYYFSGIFEDYLA